MGGWSVGDTGGLLEDDWRTPTAYKLDLIHKLCPSPSRILVRCVSKLSWPANASCERHRGFYASIYMVSGCHDNNDIHKLIYANVLCKAPDIDGGNWAQRIVTSLGQHLGLYLSFYCKTLEIQKHAIVVLQPFVSKQSCIVVLSLPVESSVHVCCLFSHTALLSTSFGDIVVVRLVLKKSRRNCLAKFYIQHGQHSWIETFNMS